MTDKVAIQGYKGSFTDLALDKLYGKKAKEVIYCKTIIDVFDSLESDTSDYALLFIGNSRYGDIGRVNDMLINSRVQGGKNYYIIGEVYLRVRHCLLAVKGTKISSVRTIYSQAPALLQCFGFIHTRLPNAIAVEQDDTALSAELVSALKSTSAAAIASKQTAKIFNLEVLAEDIQEDANNTSRFILVTLKKPMSYKGATKTSLLLHTKHKTGDLAKALDMLAQNNINLSYLQAIPIPSLPFEYRFYLDIDAGLEDKNVVKVLAELDTLKFQVETLGSYKRASRPRTINSQERAKNW